MQTGATVVRAGALLVMVAFASFGAGSSASSGLPSVANLAAPQLPPWILQISPTGGEVRTLSQIRIRFKSDLIPLEAIESRDEQTALRHLRIAPPLGGTFRFLTPRMIGFEPDRAIPKATRVRVTLGAGFSDLRGDRLTRDLSWTFESDHIDISGLPAGDHYVLNPAITLNSNVELDLASLRALTTLSPKTGGAAIPLSIELRKQSPIVPLFWSGSSSPYETFDAGARTWQYDVKPRRSLSKATWYRFKIAAGVRPARGNLASDTIVASSFETYEPLRLTRSGCDSSGRFVRGVPAMQFNNSLDEKSAKAGALLSPMASKPDWARVVVAADGGGVVSAADDGLTADTTYKLSESAELRDVYGQQLGIAANAACNTGDYTPDFWAPEGANILPPGFGFTIDISGVNLPERQYGAAYRAMQPQDLVYADSAQPQYGWMLPAFHPDRFEVLPDPSRWAAHRFADRRNQRAIERLDVTGRLSSSAGILAYGVRAKLSDSNVPAYYGLAEITNLSVFEQWFPQGGFVRVHHLSDGTPVSGAAVDIYQSRVGASQRPPARSCAHATTDSGGTASFDPAALRECMNGKSQFKVPPALLAVAHEGIDWAYARTDEYGWNGLFYAGWEAGTPISRGTILSDRSLYQPDEEGWFTLEAYYLENGVVSQDRNASYSIKLTDPRGVNTSVGRCTTNGFATCSFHIKFSHAQTVGDYVLTATGPNTVQIVGMFRVAEFKAPNFKVALSLDRELVVAGDTVRASGQSDYLFGYPVDRGISSFYVKRTQTYFAPVGWGSFTFGRQWLWPEQPPAVKSDVLKISERTSRQGRAAQAVRVAPDLPYPMSYEVDLETTDASNLSVADSKSFVALPSATLIGLNADWFGTEKKPFDVKVIAVNQHGKPALGRAIRVMLQSITYREDGKISYATVQAADVLSTAHPKTVSFTASRAGSYRIHANLAGAGSDVTATDQQIWIAGEEPVWWGTSDDPLTVKLDKPSYAPGDTANVLIQSPYKDGELYLAVIRRGIFYQTVTRMVGGAAKMQFRVTEDMLPNAVVEAVMVRRDATIGDIRSGKLKSLSRSAFASFSVKLDAQYLKVRVVPESGTVRPGGMQTVRFELTDKNGKPVRGQFTVAVANESILQLTGYRLPDLVQVVFGSQEISTRLADNYARVVLKPIERPPYQTGIREMNELAAPGMTSNVNAAKMQGRIAPAPGAAQRGTIGAPRVRKVFLPLAYYDGAVATDANGRARVTFKLPDDLTTWRVMAVAVGENTTPDWHNFRFGNSDATFVTSQPLITNALLPQFARPGDVFEGGLSVTNNTGSSGTLAIDGLLSGPLQFQTNGRSSQTNSLLASIGLGTHAYRFTMTAGAAPLGQEAVASVQFTSRLGTAADAFQLPLVLRSLTFTEQAIETGATKTRATVPLNVSSRVDNRAGGLEVSIASTLMPEIVAPARNCFDDFFDAFPFLEPVSTRLLVSADLQILSRKYGQSLRGINIPSAAAKDLDSIAKLQMGDGGFASWPGAPQSAPWLSAYAAESIGQVTAAGFKPDAAMVASLKTFLSHVLANPGQFISLCDQWCIDYTRLQALLGLNALGAQRSDYLDGIFARRRELDLFSQFELARLLTRFPQYRFQAAQLSAKLQELVYETGRYAVVNVPESWWWFDSVTATQAQALRLYSARGTSMEILDRLAQSLLARRRNGTWMNRYEDAQALTALIDYADLEPVQPKFAAVVRLAGRQIAAAQFAGYAHPMRDVVVPMAKLPRMRHDVAFSKSGQGTLHYFVAYSYRLTGAQPGAINGLRVNRQIRRAGETKIIGAMDLRPMASALDMGVGQVFDIELQLIADHPLDHVMITDPLPAGLEAVDQSFATSTPYFAAQPDSWDIDYQSIYRDRIVAYADRLGPGVYELHYLVRSVTPGLYLWPGAQAQLQFAPEEFGRSASSMLHVTAR